MTRYQVVPSGGIPNRFCILNTDGVTNAVKHLPKAVAEACCAHLNGAILTPLGAHDLAAFILHEHGFIKDPRFE